MLPASLPDRVVQAVASYISSVASMPWEQDTYLGHGHSIDCDVLTDHGVAAMILAAAGDRTADCPLPDYRGEPVALCWMTPVTAEEQAKGSAEVLGRLSWPRGLPL